jgi:hypothetical protein
MIPLLHARLCIDLACSTVFDGRQHRACPVCAFSLSAPLSKFINRPAQKEATHGPVHVGVARRG